MEKTPKVSVVLTTYNRSETQLPRAIKSVLGQTFKDFELLVVDDCSPDDTKQVVEAFCREDNRVRYIRLPQNFGSDTRPKNFGILESKGEYIAYLDDDCEFHPYHLQVLVEKLEKSPELGLVYCDMWILDEDKPENEGSQGIAMNFDGQFLLNRNYIDTSEVMHRREYAFAVGGFDEKLKKFIDWNMWVRMAKWGVKFARVPVIATNYYVHSNPKNPQKSHRVETESWYDEQLGMTMFKPTFPPSSCYIWLPYLLNLDQSNEESKKHARQEQEPRVAVFTITYDRLEYTQRMIKSLESAAKYPFDWYVWDNGSTDGTIEWLNEQGSRVHFSKLNGKNVGISGASNGLLDEIESRPLPYQIIVKVDNDCEFMTKGWLRTFVDLWKRNHMLYMSPYPEGLVNNPGGAPRVGHSHIGAYFIEVTTHIGGLCAFIDAKAYKGFRWADKFLHGNQDTEASQAFRAKRFMPCYIPMHRVMHMDTTEVQHEKFPEYFERRKLEKTTKLDESVPTS